MKKTPQNTFCTSILDDAKIFYHIMGLRESHSASNALFSA